MDPFASRTTRSTGARRLRSILTATTAALTLGVVAAPAAGAAVTEGAVRSAVQPQVATPAPAPVTYTVQPGDSLTVIGRQFGLNGPSDWRRLYDANPQIAIPDLLRIGDVLTIPAADAVLAQRELPLPPPPPAPVVREQSDSGNDDDEEEASAAPRRQRSQQRASAPAPAPAPAQASSSGGGDGVWDQLAECESGGNWGISTGNGYYGGLQFSQGSWEAVGGSGSPANASREEQIARAEQLQAQQGWDAWPSCSSQIGLR